MTTYELETMSTQSIGSNDVHAWYGTEWITIPNANFVTVREIRIFALIDDARAHLTEHRIDQITADGERSVIKATLKRDATQQVESENIYETTRNLSVDNIVR